MSVTLFDATFGAATIKQCQSSEFAPNNQVEAMRASAEVLPSELVVMGSEPRFRITSHDLATCLTALDEIGGLYVSSGTIALPWRARSPGSSFVSGSTNTSITATKGLLIPTGISAQQNQVASLDMEAVLLSSDGYTSPISHSGSVSLSSPGYEGTFRLGPTSLGGSAVTGIVGLQINFGIEGPTLEYFDGGPFPQNAYIEQANPTIEITFRNQTFLGTYGPLFSKLNSAVFSLVANADGGTIVGLDQSEHITITAGVSTVDMQGISAQGTSIAEPKLRLFCKSLTVATGEALSGGD